MKMRILGLTTVLALPCTAVFAATVAKPSINPVYAELMTSVYAHKLQVGTTIFARVTADWQGADCALRDGAILEAHVVSVVPATKADKGSQVDLAFTRAQCGSPKMGDYGLMLAALVAPPGEFDINKPDNDLPIVMGGTNSFVNVYAANGVNVVSKPGAMGGPSIPAHMKMGDVSGIKGLKLSVGTGPDNSSVLSSKDRDVALESRTVLVLVPAIGAIPRVPAAPGSAQPSSDAASTSVEPAAAPAEPPIEDIDRCVPPQCSEALPAGNTSDLGNAAASISISQLGYSPRPQRAMTAFDFEEALAYLGPRELLVTFNPHVMTQRHALGPAGWTVRVIRAAVVDTQTRRVTHTVDWEMPDDRQFLWPLGQGRVLVHVGSELRVYGEGLKIQNRIPLDGPLAFVRVTPDASFTAVGVIHERHTPELHAQLKDSLEGGEPEEDVDIQVLNRNFEPVAKSTSRSWLVAPTLLNEGQTQLLAQPNMRYRISMTPWNNHPSTLARFDSSCTPDLSSIAPDLIFLVSCDKQNEEFEYRVLRANGTLALKGFASSNEFGYAAEGSANKEAFVVKTVQSTRPVPAGALFSAQDFTSEELRVYRASDGKRLLGVRVGSPSSSRDGYALAPDSSQLAVLTRDTIAVYSVPVK
jgi:hypothetical protein